jgi:signal transduction histidine kinase
MKYFLILFLFLSNTISVLHCQPVNPDSLKSLLNNKKDTNEAKLFLDIAESYYFNKPDSCLLYAEKALSLSSQLKFTDVEVISLNTAGEALRFLGNYPQALKMQFEALRIYRQNKNKWGEARTLSFIGFVYVEFEQYKTALPYLFDSYKLAEEMSDKMMGTFILTNIGYAYDMLKKSDSALYYQLRAFNNLNTIRFVPPLKSLILTRLGNAYANLKMTDSALTYYHLALSNEYRTNDRVNTSKTQKKIAELYTALRMYDSSLYYIRLAFASAKSSGQKLEILQASEQLVNLYRIAGNSDSSFFYNDIAEATKDTLYGPEKFRQLQLLVVDEQNRQEKIRQEEERYRNRVKYIFLLAVLGIFLFVAFILFKSNRQKQKSNIVLQKTLADLRTTQRQLVQSEKMASLGELTAGIAHEIQNPLNFVNNFSEVNEELLAELVDEAGKGHTEEVTAIAENIKQNLEKINHHGKRADSIVKGMLQHSRPSTGQKQVIDVNALCDEYLRLAYHGVRAKDRSFSANFKTDFDPSVPKVNIVPQEIGRAILNLINNAFYAVNERKKLEGSGYEPNVTVSTAKENGNVEIKVKDNGNGIPQNIVDKIFQPFFTTKPTGQGTGLGLSLAYDIVKAHGGDIKVETQEGEGAEFVVFLPLV